MSATNPEVGSDKKKRAAGYWPRSAQVVSERSGGGEADVLSCSSCPSCPSCSSCLSCPSCPPAHTPPRPVRRRRRAEAGRGQAREIRRRWNTGRPGRRRRRDHPSRAAGNRPSGPADATPDAGADRAEAQATPWRCLSAPGPERTLQRAPGRGGGGGSRRRRGRPEEAPASPHGHWRSAPAHR